MNAKETPKRNYSPFFALRRIKNIQLKPAYNPFDWIYVENEYKDEIEVIEYALKRLEELEKVLDIIKRYIFKDISLYGNGTMAYIEFKCKTTSCYFSIPYEKLNMLKEYLE